MDVSSSVDDVAVSLGNIVAALLQHSAAGHLPHECRTFTISAYNSSMLVNQETAAVRTAARAKIKSANREKVAQLNTALAQGSQETVERNNICEQLPQCCLRQGCNAVAPEAAGAARKNEATGCAQAPSMRTPASSCRDKRQPRVHACHDVLSLTCDGLLWLDS